jgi:hypothetical protein
MESLETALRQELRERASTLTTPPPMPDPDRDQTLRRRGRHRTIMIAIIALIALGTGVALPNVLGPPEVTPVSDRFVIASGQTAGGHWELVLYQARLSGATLPKGDNATWWCLDLDGPQVNDPQNPANQYANFCGLETEQLAEPIHAYAAQPGFRGDETEALLYGAVAADVSELQARLPSGEIVNIALIDSPQALGPAAHYFATFIPWSPPLQLVALDENGRALGNEQVPPGKDRSSG